MAGSTRTNTLHLEFSDTACSPDDLNRIRKISNSLVADRMLVERLVIEPVNAVLSVFFVTRDPEQLWTKIQDEIYGQPGFGERLYTASSAYWQGEDYLKDHLWIHRWGNTDGVEGFEKRVQCETCRKHFNSGMAKSSLCPYCKNEVSALD
jgi:hypothetical protein